MAQLYKMTLYVCDFEENLTMEDIKRQIEDAALGTCAINCICHFADEQVGRRIEWDDDIDINKTDCPSSAWEKYFEK